jgi:DNA-binding transcriptional regulator YdaS (Cro superfamily)
MKPVKDNGLELAILRAGGRTALAALLGVSKQAVQQWQHVPAHQVIPIEMKTGVPREKLRPDLHPPRRSVKS